MIVNDMNTCGFSLQVRQTMNAADEAEAVPISSNPIDRRIPVSFPWENTIRKSSPNQVNSFVIPGLPVI